MRHCCFIPCDQPATHEIDTVGEPYDHVDACLDHVGHLLTDAAHHNVARIEITAPAEATDAWDGEKCAGTYSSRTVTLTAQLELEIDEGMDVVDVEDMIKTALFESLNRNDHGFEVVKVFDAKGMETPEAEKLKGLLRRYARTEDGYCVACGILVGWGHENDCELFPVIGDVPERSE